MRIVQPNSWSCTACVCCMATKTSLADFYGFVGHDGSAIDPASKHPLKHRGFYLQEMLRYFLYHNLYVGVLPSVPYPETFHELPGRITIEMLTDRPALVVVKSNLFKDSEHTLYWNGGEILDPSPTAKENPEFKDYEVLDWWPITKIMTN